MKKYYLFICLLVTGATFFGCSKLTLNNQAAKDLVAKTLNLPRSYSITLGIGNVDVLDEMQKEGLINYTLTYSFLDTYLHLTVTPGGKQWYLGKGSQANEHIFKTNDIDFNEITGIAIDQEQKTAVIRFTLTATNVTPVARILARTAAGFSGRNYIAYDIDAPINGELTFKKFGTGWQLQSDQNLPASELLKRILNQIR